ncbi:MAG TPA: sigma-70 family RNA polymerase sigma factor [Acidimicrobiia bacterium]|nr:sigma-70 family RNA polymerase sigma factor [Acidimicrobiia bacterium]
MDDLTRLLLHARDGDRVALAAAVRGGQPDVWRLCAHLVDRASADDLTQESFARIVRALPQYRADASGRTWMLAIARRACADAVRTRQRRRRLVRRLEATHALDDPGSRPAHDQSDSAVAALLGALGADRREAFVLTQMLGLSYDEAATACGVPVGTIRSRVARARADLVALLGDAAATA